MKSDRAGRLGRAMNSTLRIVRQALFDLLVTVMLLAVLCLLVAVTMEVVGEGRGGGPGDGIKTRAQRATAIETMERRTC